MTDFLTIAGTVYQVQRASATEKPPTYVGASKRAASGKLRSSKHDRKRGWGFTLGPMSQAAYVTLDTATADGAQVSCAGDALGATVTCEVVIGDSQYIADGLGFQRIVNVELQQA